MTLMPTSVNKSLLVIILSDFIQIFGSSRLSFQAPVLKMNAVIDTAAIVTKIVEKARLHEQWVARLQSLKTCGDRVQAKFDKLVFYFNLTLKMRGIYNFTSTDARWMIKLAQNIQAGRRPGGSGEGNRRPDPPPPKNRPEDRQRGHFQHNCMSFIVAKFFEKSRLQKEKDLAEEQWIARLHLLKTCGEQIYDDFGNLALYFNLTYKKGGINSFTSTDGRLIIVNVGFFFRSWRRTSWLGDDLLVLEKEIVDLDLLHRRTGQKIVKEVLKKAHNIRYECLRLCEALGHFQHNCKFDMIYALMVKEIKYNVGCLQYAVGQVPDFEKLLREIRF
ncbi:unnamed protein product [Caenorhabditis auriculariae]|uniref:Uncharacterized protein n=1 Tax=Caenorhabditis auriculariae TaxID=2777116 RepID=A0A8S1HTZ5_9PELO|nr:unnamed protein product [Caenorhabditis auriculariae]